MDTSWSKRQADAFVTMLKEYLHQSSGETKSSSDNYLVNIHVDQSALAGEVGRSSQPIETVKRFVDIHHIEHWANGGETAVNQLMLLCSKHHTLIHEGGFRVEKDFKDHWTFFRPDGIAVPDCGYHARDMVDDDLGYEDQGEHYENPPRGGLLSAVEKLVNEPPPPRYLH